MSSKSAAIVIHDNYTDIEFGVAYHMLKASDFDVKVFSLNGGAVKGINGWIHKTPMADGRITIPIGDGSYETDVDILVLIGGVCSVEYLRQSEALLKWIRQHNEEGKLIGSICHGASCLISSGAFHGRRITGYKSIAVDIANAGAIYVDEPVVVDQNLCSSPHYDYSGIWIKKVIELYEAKRFFDAMIPTPLIKESDIE